MALQPERYAHGRRGLALHAKSHCLQAPHGQPTVKGPQDGALCILHDRENGVMRVWDGAITGMCRDMGDVFQLPLIESNQGHCPGRSLVYQHRNPRDKADVYKPMEGSLLTCESCKSHSPKQSMRAYLEEVYLLCQLSVLHRQDACSNVRVAADELGG